MITVGQGSVGPTAVKLLQAPPGPATILLANIGTASPVYVGLGTGTTVNNGFPVPSGLVNPVAIPIPPGCASTPLYVVCAAGTAVASFLVTDPSGGTGL